MALKRRKRRGIFDRRVCQKPHNPVVFLTDTSDT